MLWRHLKHKTVPRRPNCVSVYCLLLKTVGLLCQIFLVVFLLWCLLLISPTTQLASEDGFWNVQTDDCCWWASIDWYTAHCQIDLCYCDFFSLWEEDDSLLQLGFRFFTQLRIGISGSLFWIPQFYLSQWEEILNVTASMKVSDLQPWRHLDPQPISQHHEEEKASGPATNRPASWGRRKQNRTLKEKVKKTTKTQFKWGAGFLMLQQQQQQHVCFWLSITTSPLTR